MYMSEMPGVVIDRKYTGHVRGETKVKVLTKGKLHSRSKINLRHQTRKTGPKPTKCKTKRSQREIRQEIEGRKLLAVITEWIDK